MEQEPILPSDKAKDPSITESQASRMEQAAARVDRAEERTERAEARTAEAKVRTEQAEARTEQAKARTEEAKARTEQAETRTEYAETRSEQAETRSEQAIVNSELKYRRLFEAARDGILILEVDTGRITDVNPFLTELLGFSHAEMVGRTVGELSPSKDLEWNKIMLSRLQDQGYVRYDLPLETKDGRRVAVEFVSNVYEVGGRKVIQCNIRDITQRKHAEMASARLAAIVEFSDDAIIGKDLNSVVTSWNKGAEKIFGYTAGEMVGTSIRRLVPNNFQDKEENHILGRIRRGENVGHFETRRQSKEGRIVDVSITASPIWEDTGNVIGVSIIARDITARRQAEKSLSESQANMAAAQRIAHIGSWELDLTDTNEIDADGLRWSDEMFRIAGYEPGAVAVTKEFCFSIIPEAEHAPIREAVTKAIGGGERFSVVHQLIRPDGDVRIVHEEGQIFFGAETGQPEKIIGTAHDITDQRRVEEHVLMQANMLDSMGQAVLATDLSGKIIYANHFAELLYGWSSAELMGRDVVEVIAIQATREQGEQIMEKLQEGGVWSGEFMVKRRDGTEFPAFMTDAPLRDRHGALIGIIGISEDITERKHAQEELRALNTALDQRVTERTAELSAATREAERANRAKSEFLSRMSHELRTPLHAILGFAQLLEMDGQSAEDAESVGQIIRAGKHLLGLINEVLDLAAVEAGKLELTPEPVSVRQTLGAAVSLVKPLAAARRVRLEPLAGDLDCEVLSSARHFQQIILNLLSNAVKFNREGGTVAVSCEKIEDRLRIKVADTGRGISAENMAKLFVPFERLHDLDTLTEGSGLGLSLSKHLIEAMGGSIGVESAIGTDSTFWVELPLVQRVPAAPERTLEASPSSGAKVLRCTDPRTLLCIEDNASNLRLVERVLARRPEITLISAGQGRLGLELARQHRPDLVLLDLHLPDMQGDEILHDLRADPRTADIPIVMISADATSEQIERLRAAGANDYLTKPIDVRRFLAVIDSTERRSAEPPPQPRALKIP